MTTSPTDPKKPGNKKTDALKKAWATVSSKKHRGLAIAVVVLLVGIAGVVFAVVQNNGSDEPGEEPTVVEVPNDPKSSAPPTEDDPDDIPDADDPDSNSTPSSPPEDDGDDDEAESTPSDDEPNQADYPPGDPKNRGGIHADFPLSGTYKYANTEKDGDRTTISGTVDDTNEAIMVLDANIQTNYSVKFRTLDTNKTSGRYEVEGPGMPAGTVVVITADGVFQVRIPNG